MPNKKIYFYIPGTESYNLLYFLADRYGKDLIVITSSISVKEVCEIIGLDYVNPIFYNPSDNNKSIGLDWLKNYKHISLLVNFFRKINNLFIMLIKMVQAKKMVGTIAAGSTLYYSTFLYDVPGILFLGAAIRSGGIFIKLVRPNSLIAFDQTCQPSLFSITFFLNILTDHLFLFHLDPIFGRVVGVNPHYLNVRKIQFFYDNEKLESDLSDKYKKIAFSKLNIKRNKIPKILFLGGYSIEADVSVYGGIYLKVLNLFSEIDSIDMYYKPHPLYHSINYSALKNISVLDTQIPVEFLDDGSWLYLVSFATTAFMTPKSSKCICLLKLHKERVYGFNKDGFLELLDKSSNEIIYPHSLNAIKLLLEG